MIKARLLIILVAAVPVTGLPGVSNAAAELDPADFAKCTEISSSVERLACFDDAASKSGLGGKTETSKPRGEWHSWTDTNKFTDRLDAFTSVEAKNVVQMNSYKTARPRLYIRCTDNTTALVVNFGGFLTTDETYLRYRIGDRKPATARWDVSTNFESAGLWRGGQSIPFIKSLFGEERLLVEVTPHGESPVSAEFNITGVEEAVSDVRKYCNW
ncbi:type VI secretion system-associated protein TagO [Hoeflea sp.]|uniref:type VI secretion system-associated protein TagO n=1 Tax=Hoeflea sp. TaxID=1940281 RepID=UPI001995780A|nr:type VI secretion system-associated protein TagO [Hoeflea sp.]MBC7282640.1 hypothetical protein [Hoeflea sp.]